MIGRWLDTKRDPEDLDVYKKGKGKEAIRRDTRKKAHSMHVVLESGHKNSGDAQRIFSELKKELDDDGINLLKTMTLASKAECEPLMIADMIAHSTYSMNLRVRAGGPSRMKGHDPAKTSVTRLHFPDGGIAATKERLVAAYLKRVSARHGPHVSGRAS